MCRFLYFFGTKNGIDFVFFFQAEDGIRDRTVTGVQTCALPIWIAAQCVRHQHRQRVQSAPEVDRARGHQYAKTRADRYHRVVRAAKNTSRKTERSTGPLIRMRTSPNSTSTTQASFTTGAAGASPDTTMGTNAGPPRTLPSAFFVASAACRRQRNKRLGLMS